MYPAHIRETGERQTVREHCRNTAALAANALRPLGLEKSAYLAGLLHDAGKTRRSMRTICWRPLQAEVLFGAASTTPSPASDFCWTGGIVGKGIFPIPM